MASIGGLGNGVAGAPSGLKGFGGLASGLDRDTLIQGMTYATRAKISMQLQKKQLLSWEQTAVRGISTKMIDFSRKYTSYTNPATNLSSKSFFSRNKVTALGNNSKHINVTGSSSLTESLSILGVKSMASSAKMTSTSNLSDQLLSTGVLNDDMTVTEAVSNLEAQSLSFKHGNTNYRVTLGTGTRSDGFTYDYTTPNKAAESINKSLEGVTISGGKNLSDVLEAEVQQVNDGSGNMVDTVVFKSKDTAGNEIKIMGGSGDVLKNLGILKAAENIGSVPSNRLVVTNTGLIPEGTQELNHQATFAERVGGKNISFDYNGQRKQMKMPTKDELTNGKDVEINGATVRLSGLDLLKHDLQTQLDKAYGKGRIQVDKTNAGTGMSSLNFKTVKPDGTDDSSSVLTLASSDSGVLGKSGAFKVDYGESNRLNMDSSLTDSGLRSAEVGGAYHGVGGGVDLDLVINGVKIGGLTTSSSMKEVINKINESDAGVKVNYLKQSDKFVLESTTGGAGGQITFGGTDTTDASGNFTQVNGAAFLFGTDNTTNPGAAGHGYQIEAGTDAVIAVQYEGSNQVVELVRGNNSINVDGLNITLQSEFGFDATGNLIPGTEPITFKAEVDSEKIVSAVTDMVKDFNEILELVNKEGSTKPDKDYPPLTDEQKSAMSEDQIKNWEEKAKVGTLFNDSDIRSLSDKLRFIFGTGSEGKQKMEAMGISTSKDYSDNGKLVFDETKFKAALESNPEGVQELFTESADKVSGDKGGLMSRLTMITEQYASTTGATKGILIERAGSPSAPTSVLHNSLQKRMNDLDAYVDRLKDKLKIENDRYVKQFANLETVISQLNSQSEWMNQQFGGM